MSRDVFFFFQAEDGIRDLVRSRGLGDVYKRQETYDLVVPAGVWEARPAQNLRDWLRSAEGRAALDLSLIHI